MLTNKKISIIIVCYNDGGSVKEMYRRVKAEMNKITDNYEIIYVNDNSPDDAFDVLKDLAAKDDRLVVISHTRNFGGQNAYTSGLDYCTGDAAILLDGDIQDPPEMFSGMVKKWQDGYEVVYGERVSRQGGIARRIGYKIFYRLFRKMSYINIPLDAGDFSLLDRKVIDGINAFPETDRYVRGLRAWLGYKSIGLPYTRAERFSGKTNISFMWNVRWAKKLLFSFSYEPLELISYIAAFVTGLAGIGMIIYIILALFYPAPQGFLTLLVIILFIGAVQLLCLSIIGEYLARIFEEVKKRPNYIRKSILNDYKGVMSNQHKTDK